LVRPFCGESQVPLVGAYAAAVTKSAGLASPARNIRLSSDVANPLIRSRNSWADGDGCIALHPMQVSRGGGLNGVTDFTVSAWLPKAGAPFSSFHPCHRLSAVPGAGRPLQRALVRIVERSHLDWRKPVQRFFRFNRVPGNQDRHCSVCVGRGVLRFHPLARNADPPAWTGPRSHASKHAPTQLTLVV
jgi:hypothetical protein